MHEGLRVVTEGLNVGDKVIIDGFQASVGRVGRRTEAGRHASSRPGEAVAAGMKSSVIGQRINAADRERRATRDAHSRRVCGEMRLANHHGKVLHRSTGARRRHLGRDPAGGTGSRQDPADRAVSRNHAADGPGVVLLSGASAKVVRDTVAAPIEQQVNGVENMLYMSSQCTNDGGYNLTVTFELGTNLDMAQVLVQNRVNLAMPSSARRRQGDGRLDEEEIAQHPARGELHSDDDPKTHKPLFDQLYLSNFATIQIKDELARLKGVGDVSYMGQQDYSMRIWLDPEKLASNNLTASDVVNVLKEQNVQVAAGQIGQQPVPTGQDFQYTLSTLGRLVEPEQFEQIVVKTGPLGAGRSACSDVSRSELGAKNQDTRCTLDGKPSIGLVIYQLPGSNALETADSIRAKMKELAVARFPAGMHYDIVYDTTPFIKESVDEVFHDAARRRDSRGDRRAAVPAGLEGDDPADDRRARLARRHVRDHVSDGLYAQQPDAVRTGAGDRHCGGRRDRRPGSRRDEAGQGARRRDGHDRGDGRNHRRHHRHHARLVLGVSAERVDRRDQRPVLPTVRADDCRFDDHLGHQRDDDDTRRGPGSIFGSREARADTAIRAKKRCRGGSLRSSAA